MNTTAKRTVGLLAASILLVACGKPVDAQVESVPTVTPTSASQSVEAMPTDTPMDSITEEPVPSDTETAQDDSEIVAKFGETVTWRNGLQVNISKPKRFYPSDTAAGGGDYNIVVTVKLTNKTGKSFDPTMFSILASDDVGDVEEIFDSAKGIDGSPSARLRNGKSTTWRVAFALHEKTTRGFTVQAQPSSVNFDESYRLAIFEN